MASDEPVIHVIPEQFYGAALKKKLPKEEPAKPAANVPPRPPVPKPPGAPSSSKKKGGLWLVLAVVALVLVGGGIAAFLALRAPSVTNTNVAVAPTAPSCGNGKCESGETTESCASDCPAPPPICGNGKCEGSETSASCPGDCAPPAPICGDGKCDATETADACPADCKPPAPVPGKDSDSDGLTDAEETEIYGTNPNASNSDADSFVDLNEVLNLFDPAKPTPAKLEDNPGIAKYFVGPAVSFHLLYPSSWSAGTPSAEGSVVFTAKDGESVTVKLASDWQVGQSLVQYFDSRFPGGAGSVFKTKSGHYAVFSPDRMTAFIQEQDFAPIHVLTYDFDGSKEIQYKVTFEMMVNSFIPNEGAD